MAPVDAFVEENVRPEFRDIVDALRRLMREAAPGATEQMSYGLPMWKARGYLAYVSPSRQGITFGFPYGVHFADPHGRLSGTAKHARHLKLRRTSDLDADVLRFYVEQAIARDTDAPAGA